MRALLFNPRRGECSGTTAVYKKTIDQAPVVQKLDSAIHYSVDSAIQLLNNWGEKTGRNLLGGCCYLPDFGGMI